MVFKTEMEAVCAVSNAMVLERSTQVTVRLKSRPSSIEKLTETIFELHPELVACVESLSCRAGSFQSCCELTFEVAYNKTMPSTVTVLKETDEALCAMLRSARHHERTAEMVLPKELEQSVKLLVSGIRDLPVFLDCFLKGTMMSIRRLKGSRFCALSVRFMYYCSDRDYLRRNSGRERSIDHIAQIASAKGIEDWRRAFETVQYCVENWRYGKTDDLPEVEFTSYGALVKQTAVCMGIALGVCAVFSRLGIPCRYIRGERNGVGHAWNMIYVRGGWFFIDVTDAIGMRDPYYNWGITSFDDRTISDKITVTLNCTVPVPFIRKNIS